MNGTKYSGALHLTDTIDPCSYKYNGALHHYGKLISWWIINRLINQFFNYNLKERKEEIVVPPMSVAGYDQVIIGIGERVRFLKSTNIHIKHLPFNPAYICQIPFIYARLSG